MNRSTFVSAHRVVSALIALAFALLVGAAAFLLTRQSSIPLTGQISPARVEANVQRSFDLGAGYRLEMNGQQGKIVAPAAQARTVRQSIDLGAGHRLEMTGTQGKIVAPARASYQRLDLGAGYVLETVNGTGRIAAPAASSAQAAPAQPQQDLGSGYWLENGQIVKEGSR